MQNNPRSDSTFNWRLYWSFSTRRSESKTNNIWCGKPNPTTQLLYKKLVKNNIPLFIYICERWLGFFRFLPSSLNFDTVLYSCDIEILYTSIPIELGIGAIDHWIKRKRNLIPEPFTKKFITGSIKFVLKNDNFLFDSKMFNQVFGTVMVTKCAPPYACFTIGYQEETKRFTQELRK